jgi:hypothetical protein
MEQGLQVQAEEQVVQAPQQKQEGQLAQARPQFLGQESQAAVWEPLEQEAVLCSGLCERLAAPLPVRQQVLLEQARNPSSQQQQHQQQGARPEQG